MQRVHHIVLFMLFGLLIGMGIVPVTSIAATQQERIDAWVKAKPAIADTPLEINVSSPQRNINGRNQHVGWSPRIRGRVVGHSRRGDAIFVELSQNGKALMTLRAGLEGTDTWYEDWSIDGNEERDLSTVTGKITATFKYYDDNTEETVVQKVRTFTVFRKVKYDDSINQWGGYGVNYDDLLGFSYLAQRNEEWDQGYAGVWIYCWLQRPRGYFQDISYRIEVNGERIELPDDFGANNNHTIVTSLEQEESFFSVEKNDRLRNVYNSYLIVFRPYLMWGKRPDDMEDDNQRVWMVEHPGKWVLKIRSEGQVIRELRFTVNPDGTIAPHPEQDPTKPGFMNLGAERFFAETYYPNPNMVDDRFNPAAIRAGTFFGRPWISDEVKNGMLPALPPPRAGAMAFPLPALPPSKR